MRTLEKGGWRVAEGQLSRLGHHIRCPVPQAGWMVSRAVLCQCVQCVSARETEGDTPSRNRDIGCYIVAVQARATCPEFAGWSPSILDRSRTIGTAGLPHGLGALL